MKRLAILVSLLIGGNAHAAIISVQPYISGNDVTISTLNTNQNTIVNAINGNIEGGSQNIKAGSINSQELAQAVSPIVRWSDSFNDYTVSGMLGVTDSDLTSDISAGVSYVKGYRVVTGATSHTYTASKDTYVYIHKGGYFVYQEVANGAAAPSTPADTLLLFKAVTNGTAITSISDLRTTSIQITTTTTNFPADYRNQCFMSRDTTTTIHAEAGQVAIGTTVYSRTTDGSTKSLATATNWIEGSVPATNGTIYVYAYNDAGSSWDYKFASADPIYSDASANTAGVLRYYATGGTTYRAIGWAYKSADAVQLYQNSDFKDAGTANFIERFNATQVTTASTSYVNDNFADMKFYSSGGPVEIIYQTQLNNDGTSLSFIALAIDGTTITGTEVGMLGGSSSAHNVGVTAYWTGYLAQGTHTIQGKFRAGANSAYINTRRITAKQMA